MNRTLEVSPRSKVGRALLKAIAAGEKEPSEENATAFHAELHRLGETFEAYARRRGWRSHGSAR